MVMRRISGFLREFRRMCPRFFCGGLCMSFIRCAYLHTTSSVVVHHATVSVGNLGLCVCLPCCPSASVYTLCARRAHAVGTLQCALRSGRGDLFVACVFCVTGVVGVFTLPTRVTQPSFFPDVLGYKITCTGWAQSALRSEWRSGGGAAGDAGSSP
jgi:hypothetical protein